MTSESTPGITSGITESGRVLGLGILASEVGEAAVVVFPVEIGARGVGCLGPVGVGKGGIGGSGLIPTGVVIVRGVGIVATVWVCPTI